MPFSPTFYRWLLGEEHTLTLADVEYVNYDVYMTLCKLQDVVRQKEGIERDSNLKTSEKMRMIQSLEMDGCGISDLGLVFQLPGYDNIELRKGGSDISVTIHNLDQYIKVQTSIE